MPRKPRELKNARTSITEADFVYFSSGDFFEAEGYADGKKEADLREFWLKHADIILKRYLSELKERGKAWAGRRPWAYWQWSITAPRLKTGTREYFEPWPSKEKIVKDVYESDLEYCRRLGLLEDWEK